MKSLFRLLHGHFIPSHHNGYQPHFLRFKTAAGILVLILAIEVLYLAQAFIILPKSASFAAIFASVLLDQTNQNRIGEQLGTLTRNPVLEKAAQLKADDMAAKGYFSHNSPEGKTPWYWFEQAGYDYAAAGENLAVNFTDSKDVTEAWMHSPAHRANIMSGNYTEIGIATAHGIYKGKEAVFVVQEFGRPSLVAQVPAQPMPLLSQKTPAIITSTPRSAAAVRPVAKPIIPTPKTIATPSVVVNSPKVSTTTTVVAGAETTRLDTPITIETQEIPTAPPTAPSTVDKLIASPRQVTTTIYLILTAILLLALGLAVFVKIRIQHPHIIANGILLIAITLSLVVLNAALGFTQGMI